MLPKLRIECFQVYSNHEKSLTKLDENNFFVQSGPICNLKNHGLRNRDPWQAITKVYQGSSVLITSVYFYRITFLNFSSKH